MTDQPALTRVTIDAPGPTITIEAHEPLEAVASTALALWRIAGKEIHAPKMEAGSIGFAETRGAPTHYDISGHGAVFPPPHAGGRP